MKNENELVEKDIKSLFWKYALPSMATMIIMSIYFVVDAIFIGKGIGSEALAAVNLTIPFLMIINSLSMSLAMAGAVIISIYLSKKTYNKANNVFSSVILTNIGISLIFFIVGLMFSNKIAVLLGSTPETTGMVVEYLSIILYFVLFFSLQVTLSNVVRNDGNPNLAMFATIGGSLLNIPLDYLFIFIFDWGIKGAALATGLSQVTGVVVLLSHFILKKGHISLVFPKIETKEYKRIFMNAFPILLGNIYLPISLFLMNNIAKAKYGTLGISAFAIVSSVSLFLFMILIGLAQGIQPIISFNYGQRKSERIKKTFLLGIKNISIITVVMVVLIFVFSEQIIGLYTNDVVGSDLYELTKNALHIYIFGFLFLGINYLFLSYFQSTESIKSAIVVNIFRSAVILVPISFFIPLVLPVGFIWTVVMISELITLGVLLKYFSKEIVYIKDEIEEITPLES